MHFGSGAGWVLLAKLLPEPIKRAWPVAHDTIPARCLKVVMSVTVLSTVMMWCTCNDTESQCVCSLQIKRGPAGTTTRAVRLWTDQSTGVMTPNLNTLCSATVASYDVAHQLLLTFGNTAAHAAHQAYLSNEYVLTGRG